MLALSVSSAALGFLLIFGGLFVLFREHRRAENLIFFAVCILSSLWGIAYANIEVSENIHVATFLNAASYVLGVLLMLAVVAFTYVFPRRRKLRFLIYYGLGLLPVAFLSATPLVAGSVTKVSADPPQYEFTYNAFSLLYAFILFVGFILIIRNLLISKGMDRTEKAQANLVAFGFLLSFTFGLSLSTLVPVFVEHTPLDDLAPFSLLFLLVFSGIAVIRHKMFDIRLIVARSVAYILALVFLGAVYGFTAFYLFDQILLENEAASFSSRATYVLLALVSGLSFAPAKKVFDRLSNRIFYRDAYDPQRFIDSLTGVLVSNADIAKLIEGASELIDDNLKPVFTEFILHDKRYKSGKIAHALPAEEVGRLFTIVQQESGNVIALDDEVIKGRPDYRRLYRQDVAIIVRLASRSEFLGVMLLGVKQSGNIYNRQDREVFSIVADELALAIENSLSYQEIQQFNKTLQQEVEDATRQLRNTNEKLKSLDETKDEFISMASHQLRTPLTSVKGYLSMVLDGDMGELNDQQRKMLTQAFTSSQRMNYLISDLLNVSRLRTGKFVIEPSDVYLPDVIEGEIEQLHETARAKNQTLTFDKPAEFPVLQLDETKIRQVIMNFMDNALHYTPDGGKIRVELEARQRAVEFRVIDNGLGVPRAEQHKLFGKFFRAGNARHVRPDGTGLGLFMAKKVVIAQGGSIIFKSQEGKGSTFGFTFPRKHT